MKHEIVAEGNGVRVKISEDVDLHVAPELRDILRRAGEGRPAVLVVDLGGVPFMDSSGIATIVEALKNARKASRKLVVEGCQAAVRDTFEIAGLTEILGIR